MYAEWCELEQRKYETYTSAVPKFPPFEQNKVFKPIKNAVIRAVLAMECDLEMVGEYEEEDSEKKRSEISTVQNAVTFLFITFGRLISDDYDRSAKGQRLRTEHKLKAAIRCKKSAFGLKENPLEKLQYKTCK